jgi:hypothetical protein
MPFTPIFLAMTENSNALTRNEIKEDLKSEAVFLFLGGCA